MIREHLGQPVAYTHQYMWLLQQKLKLVFNVNDQRNEKRFLTKLEYLILPKNAQFADSRLAAAQIIKSNEFHSSELRISCRYRIGKRFE